MRASRGLLYEKNKNKVKKRGARWEWKVPENSSHIEIKPHAKKNKKNTVQICGEKIDSTKRKQRKKGGF